MKPLRPFLPSLLLVCLPLCPLPAWAARGQLLILSDPGARLDDPPVVTLRCGEELQREVRPLDDGEGPDHTAGDGRYTASAPLLPPGPCIAIVTWNGDRQVHGFTAEALETDRPILLVTLEEDALQVEQTDPDRLAPSAGEHEIVPLLEEGEHGELRTGLLALLLVVGGVEVAVLLLLLRGREPRSPVPELNLGQPAPCIAPRRLDPEREAEQGADLLAHLLTRGRVVVAGPPDRADPPGVAYAPDGLLPAELVAAVERLAACPGPPVSLVVRDPRALDAPGLGQPLTALDALVDGRFPLFAVGGPAHWDPWAGPSRDPREDPSQDPRQDPSQDPSRRA